MELISKWSLPWWCCGRGMHDCTHVQSCPEACSSRTQALSYQFPTALFSTTLLIHASQKSTWTRYSPQIPVESAKPHISQADTGVHLPACDQEYTWALHSSGSLFTLAGTTSSWSLLIQVITLVVQDEQAWSATVSQPTRHPPLPIPHCLHHIWHHQQKP